MPRPTSRCDSKQGVLPAEQQGRCVPALRCPGLFLWRRVLALCLTAGLWVCWAAGASPGRGEGGVVGVVNTQSEALKGRSPIEATAGELAAKIRKVRRFRVGTVSEVSRKGFRVNLGEKAGIEPGLDAEVFRPEAGRPSTQRPGACYYADEDSLRVIIAGQAPRITRAKVTNADSTSSLLRSTDPLLGRRVKKGDIVRILEATPSVMVGHISGTAPALAQSLRHSLAEQLDKSGAPAVALSGTTQAMWPQGQPAELCSESIEMGCPLAVEGTLQVSDDSLSVVIGLVDVSRCETIRILVASAWIDPALAATIKQSPAETPVPTTSRGGLGLAPPYTTGLSPAFKEDLNDRALAVYILDEYKALCVAGESSLEIYLMDAAAHRLLLTSECAINPSSSKIPCRDQAGRLGMADANGDGRSELVLWANVFPNPMAFSVLPGERPLLSSEKTAPSGEKVASPGEKAAPANADKRGPLLEPAEAYWLPWSDPLGDVRYVPGTNYMVTRELLDHGLYDWRRVDLDCDGERELVLAGADGALVVCDQSGQVLAALDAVGAPIDAYDMNLDGRAEIIVTCDGCVEGQDAVRFLDYSEGNFNEVWHIEELPADIICVAAGRLDGDELPDLVLLLRADMRAVTSSVLVALTGADTHGAR